MPLVLSCTSRSMNTCPWQTWQLNACCSGPIVTRTDPLKAFYPAEAYHQDFLTLNPRYPYIVINDLPKVENLKRLFPTLYRDAPVLVTKAKS